MDVLHGAPKVHRMVRAAPHQVLPLGDVVEKAFDARFDRSPIAVEFPKISTWAPKLPAILEMRPSLV